MKHRVPYNWFLEFPPVLACDLLFPSVTLAQIIAALSISGLLIVAFLLHQSLVLICVLNLQILFFAF